MAAKKKTKKKTGAKKSAAKKPNALDFCRAYLRKDRTAPFAVIRDAAKKKGFTLYPISYGRAQALEGIVKPKPYGSKKKTAAKRGPGRPKGSKNKRGPGRPPKVTSGLDSIENLVATLKTLQQERDQALRAVDKIRAIIAEM